MEGTHDLNPSDATISAGGWVTWTNNSATNHQIWFEGGPRCDYTLIGKSVSIQFPSAGTFTYVDTIYPTYMSGTVTVK